MKRITSALGMALAWGMVSSIPTTGMAQTAFFPEMTQPVDNSSTSDSAPAQDSTAAPVPSFPSPITAPPVDNDAPLKPEVEPTKPAPAPVKVYKPVKVRPTHPAFLNNPKYKPVYTAPIEHSVQVEPAGGYPGTMHYGYWQPGHYRQLTGSPYFYSPPGAGPRGPLAGNGGAQPTPATSIGGDYNNYSANPNYAPAPHGNPAVDSDGAVIISQQPVGAPAMGMAPPVAVDPYAVNNNYAPSIYPSQVYPQGGYAPSGYAANSGISGGAPGGDPYQYHFGPGYYRSGEYGHYRFPYYSYRRPWYHPGFAGYNRDTNLPW